MTDQSNPTSAQPNRWHSEQLWRFPFPRDRERAAHLRRALVELKLYPSYDLTQNPNLGVWEANRRAALPLRNGSRARPHRSDCDYRPDPAVGPGSS